MIQIIYGCYGKTHNGSQATSESSVMSHRSIMLVSIIVALASLSLWATEKHNGHKPAMKHNAMENNDVQAKEGGQATFAALVEIVSLLEQDDNTDWSTVDLDVLRAHLLDMNQLILNTEATKSTNGDTQIQFDIRGTTASIPSIHRMVPAHSRFIEQSRGWVIDPELNEVGAKLTITVNNASTLSRLNALGFYGFMSLDSHHQAHHYRMAVGRSH